VILLGAGAGLLVGCAGDAEVIENPLTLAEASSQVTFASTEELGAHRFLATRQRTEHRNNSEHSHHVEVVEIRWESWDHFRYTRHVDDRPVEEVVVYDGEGWTRRGEQWRRVSDAEPHRTQLRMSWNAWDQVTALFGEQVTLEAAATESVEGRLARRYTVSLPATLQPSAAGGPRSGGKLEPRSLNGMLWVDEATAVRLTGSLSGVLARDGYTQEHTLQLARTDIGVRQDIKPPHVGRDE
jgi:hypothetical protein